MTMNDEIIVMWIELFAGIWVWSWIAALAFFIIGGILFSFSKLLKAKNTFLSVCALNFMRISEVLSYIGLVASVLMIIPVISKIPKQLEMYLRWNNNYRKSWISKYVGDIKMKILSIVCLTILFLITSPMLIIIFGSIEIFKLYKYVLKITTDFLEKN